MCRIEIADETLHKEKMTPELESDRNGATWVTRKVIHLIRMDSKPSKRIFIEPLREPGSHSDWILEKGLAVRWRLPRKNRRATKRCFPYLLQHTDCYRKWRAWKQRWGWMTFWTSVAPISMVDMQSHKYTCIRVWRRLLNLRCGL